MISVAISQYKIYLALLAIVLAFGPRAGRVKGQTGPGEIRVELDPGKSLRLHVTVRSTLFGARLGSRALRG